MKRASFVAVSLCVLAGAGRAHAEPPMKPAQLPVIASVTQPTPAEPTTEAAAPAKPTPPPAPAITLIARIDLATQRLTVSEYGKPKYTWLISSGTEEFRTPVGTFQPQWMSKMWYSKKYDLAPMPHAVFFKDGVATHATQATGSLGRPASHGCVRLAPANAETFYGLVQRHGLVHTRINVFGTPRFQRAPVDAVASRRDRQPSTYQRVAVNGTGYGYAGYNGSGGSVFYMSPSQQGFYRPGRYQPSPYQYRVR